MAKSRDSARDPPAVQSEEDSREEEEVSSEEGTECSESESEPKLPQTQKSQVNKKQASVSKVPKPQPSKTQGSSSDDEESDSETGSGSLVKEPTSPNTKNPRFKPKTSEPTASAKTAPAARTKRLLAYAEAADGETKEAKRSKKKSETGVERSEGKGVSTDESKKLFKRLWSEDDEIVILQGMLDFRETKKSEPWADLNSFFEYIKKEIQIDVSKTQLQDKVRRLKKRYENNFTKEEEGKAKVSSKPHEQKAYELSKKIWGKGSNAMDNTVGSPRANRMSVRRSGIKNAVTEALAPKMDERNEAVTKDNNFGGEKWVEGFKNVIVGLGDPGIGSWIAKNGMAMIKVEKRDEMEEQWKKLNVAEIEIHAKKLELMLENTKLVLEAIKSSQR